MDSGFLKCKILRAEPVNQLTGQVHVEQQDFSLPGRVPLSWTRLYDSGSEAVGSLGRGWRTLADTHLERDEDGDWLLYGAGPGALVFPGAEVAEGSPTRCVGGHAELRQVEPGLWEVWRRDGPTVRLQGAGDHARVVALVDAYGNGWRFQWGPEGLRSLEDEAGRRIVVDTESGRITRLRLQHPEHGEVPLVRYEHEAGQLAAVWDAMEQPYRFAYNDRGRMVRHTTRTGLSFHYRWEGGKVVHAWGDGGLHDYHFDYRPDRTVATDAKGAAWTLEHEDHLPLREIDPLGLVTSYTYDDDGHTTSVTTPGGRVTTYAYDARGNLLGTTLPDGATTEIQVDAQDHVVTITDPTGGVWSQAWDGQDRVVRQVDPTGAETRYSHDPRGDLVSLQDALGRQQRFVYDDAGLLSEQLDAQGGTTRLTRDGLGNLISQVDVLGRVQTSSYDRKGRLVDVTLASGRRARAAWDADDRLEQWTDSAGHSTRMSWFGVDSVAARHLPDGTVVRYSYDADEQLTAVHDQRGRAHLLHRDPAGRLVGETDYWGGRREYTLDDDGQVVRIVDANGRALRARYDRVGQVIETRDDAGRIEQFSYDRSGRILRSETPDVVTERTWDPCGRLLTERFGGVDVALSYDAVGRVVGRKSSLGHEVGYRWNANDGLIGVEVDGQCMALERDALGRRIADRFGSTERRYGYDVDDRMTERVLSAAGTTHALSYTYDDADNLVERRWSSGDQTRSRSMLYDPCGRIVRETDPLGVVTPWLRDPCGDLVSTGPLQGGHRTARLDHRSWTYDAAGAMVSRTQDGDEDRLTWDGRQRLVAFAGQSGTSATYGYDASWRRSFKEVDGVRTDFAWVGEQLLAELGPEGAKEFVYLPGTFVPVAMVGPEGVRWLGTDPNGMVTEVYGANGELTQLGDPDSRGGVTGLSCPLVGQGQYADEETGLLYTRHRYYDPETEAFISADPLGIVPSENTYRLGPNVWGWVDPLGLACKPRSPAEAANMVRRGQGPRGISRIDSPKIKGEQWHAHLGRGEGSPAVNLDGSWKHPGAALTKKQADFLRSAGWDV